MSNDEAGKGPDALPPGQAPSDDALPAAAPPDASAAPSAAMAAEPPLATPLPAPATAIGIPMGAFPLPRTRAGIPLAEAEIATLTPLVLPVAPVAPLATPLPGSATATPLAGPTLPLAATPLPEPTLPLPEASLSPRQAPPPAPVAPPHFAAPLPVPEPPMAVPVPVATATMIEAPRTALAAIPTPVTIPALDAATFGDAATHDRAATHLARGADAARDPVLAPAWQAAGDPMATRDADAPDDTNLAATTEASPVVEAAMAADALPAAEPPDAARPPPPAQPPPPAAAWAPIGALRPRIAYPLAILSGLLYFLAFPGIDVWPLAFVALTPLLLAMRGQPTRRAAGLGWTAGFTMTMTGFYWLMEMLKVFSGFPAPLCFLFMCLLCAFQGGRIGLCGWLYGRAANRGWPAELVFLGAFATSELVYPLLFPWYFGATMHLAPAFGQLADIGGPLLVGLMVATPSVALAEIILARRQKRARSRGWVIVGAVVPAVAALYGVVRIHMVDAAVASADKIKLGIVQPNQGLHDRKSALALHQRMTKELAKENVDLVVWSEAAVPMGFDEKTYETDVPRKISNALGVSTVVGTVLVREEPNTARGRRLFNTALIADEKGAIGGRYDKHYLLMFGEYLPFGDLLPVLYKYSPNSGKFSPGDTLDALDWRGHRIGALICYEDIIPSFVNQLMRHDDPDLLVNLTNDAWFGNTTEPWIHFALAKMRAIEQRRFLVRATNSGVSGIIDPVGRVVVNKGTFVTEKIVGEVGFLKGSSVYRMIGDIPWYLVALAMAAMSVLTIPARWRRPAR